MAFCAVMENRVIAIDQQISSRRANLIAANHLKLQSVAATVIFCGQQVITLRDHCDDGPVLMNEVSNSRGHFQALSHFP